MTKNMLRAALTGLAVLLSASFCIITPNLSTRSELEFSPDQLPEARMELPYEVEILISQNETPVGDYSISDGALPPGLELIMDEQDHSAKITGAPTQAGMFSFTVSVWCYGTNVSGQTGEKKYTIVVGE